MGEKNQRSLTVALTGGIGTGKSTVAELFKALGVPIIDTDQASRELVQSGSDCLKAIVDRFGKEMIDEKGELKRSLLREHIFNAPKDRIWLEKLLHPRIFLLTQQKIKEVTYPYVVIVIPLLIESGKKDFYDEILVVDAPEHLQVERASQRDGIPPDQIKLMIAAQCSPEERIACADDIIINEDDLESLKEQVRVLHEKYLSLAGNH